MNERVPSLPYGTHTKVPWRLTTTGSNCFKRMLFWYFLPEN